MLHNSCLLACKSLLSLQTPSYHLNNYNCAGFGFEMCQLFIKDLLELINIIVLKFIMHLLQNSPDNRGMIILYDIRSLQNCACANVIRRYLRNDLKRTG